MNEANITTNDVNIPEMPLDSVWGPTVPGSRTRSEGCTVYRPTFRPPANWQVSEDKGFYIPDLLSDADYDADPTAYAAFEKHAKHVHEAEGLLNDAWNLVGLMLASLGDKGDSRAMQTEAGLKAVEKKLSKAHRQFDKHHTRYTNLFFAHFDLMSPAV